MSFSTTIYTDMWYNPIMQYTRTRSWLFLISKPLTDCIDQIKQLLGRKFVKDIQFIQFNDQVIGYIQINTQCSYELMYNILGSSTKIKPTLIEYRFNYMYDYPWNDYLSRMQYNDQLQYQKQLRLKNKNKPFSQYLHFTIIYNINIYI